MAEHNRGLLTTRGNTRPCRSVRYRGATGCDPAHTAEDLAATKNSPGRGRNPLAQVQSQRKSGFSLLPNRAVAWSLEEVNPPLDALPLHSPAPMTSVAGSGVLTPAAVHDLRDHAIRALRYPPRAAVVFSGVPGAGKSTALRKLFGSTADHRRPPRGPAGSVVLDSLHARNRLTPRLRMLPYPLWRPVVHLAHYTAIRRALRTADGPVIIHDCGTFAWSRRLIARWTAAAGRDLHVVMIDVPPTVARAGQYARGRRSNGLFFTLHCRRWDELIAAMADAAPAVAASVVIVDRAAINRVQEVRFDAGAAPSVAAGEATA
ncbi:hypothetical protein NFA_13470 [Nocardia farcinica IFM 10152]|uniref:ATP/GTP-binding protein n=3 Tax=Nocardia farcinica TaxID=37329 RepID=Q5Z049_NOCFA|nr:hypothetical protein NFA_13470 [Nocardia farcinica IFM 10152]